MSDIQFDEETTHYNKDRFGSQQVSGTGQASGMTRWLMEKGIIKNEESSKYIFFVVIVFNLALMTFIFYKFA